ncbi:Quinone oxidoreductase PIG3 [Linum perenne]
MKAVVINSPGGPEVLQLRQVDDPTIKDDEILIKVGATAVNRADTVQRLGKYPPPKGSSELLGLECSGTVESVGRLVSRWKPGDEVCALLSGGGYAEKVAVPEAQVFPLPLGVSLIDAAAFPEVACTVWSTIFMSSRLSPGESLLAPSSSLHSLVLCSKGHDLYIFIAGVDVILDCLGASYFQRNLDSLNFDGRLFIIGMMGGAKTEMNIPSLFAKRLTVQAAGLRYRTAENKAAIVSEVHKHVWPAIAAGKVKPVVYKVFPFSEAADAHRLIESSQHIGKILLVP